MKTILLLAQVVVLLVGSGLVGCGQPDDNRPGYFKRRPVYNDDAANGRRQFETD